MNNAQACPFRGCTEPLREGEPVVAMHFGASGPPTLHENEDEFSYVHAGHATDADRARASRVIVLPYQAAVMAPGAICRRCGADGQVGGMCGGCRADLAEGTTAAQYADRITLMVREDAASSESRVPADVPDWSTLHEHTDANMYLIEARVPYHTEEDIALLNAVLDEVERRLPALMAGVRTEQGDLLRRAAEAGWQADLGEDEPDLGALIATWISPDASQIDYATSTTIRELLPAAERHMAACKAGFIS